MRIHIAPGQIAIEDAEGEREVLKLSDIIDYPGNTPEESAAYLLRTQVILQFVTCFQIVEVNQRLGHFDPEKQEGTGLVGLNAQQVTSLLEVSEHVGRLSDGLAELREQSVDSQDPEKIMGMAEGMIARTMAGLGVTPPSTKVTRPGNGEG